MFDINWQPILRAIMALIQMKLVHSSVSYQQATYKKYDRRAHESLSGYGPLRSHLGYVYRLFPSGTQQKVT